jgi:two-component system, OmpR family, response regulator
MLTGARVDSSAHHPDQHGILLVEDDDDMGAEIITNLQGRDYQLTRAETGPDGLQAARNRSISLVIADRMLPEMDGLSMIAALRSEGIQVPVLVLSALGSVDDRIRGLSAGGDDYLTKPFAMEELAARVAALLRRPVETRETVLRLGPLMMDLIDRTVHRGERELDLLPREFKLLEYMMRRPGQTLTRAMLLEDVWHYHFVLQTNLVDVHMGKLRRKVDSSEEKPMVSSVRGVGYMLSAPD